jgi:hypothetical protein
VKHPFVFSLDQRLSEELRHFKNNWFFKWHFIGENRETRIDAFDGSEIVYGGLTFDGSPRLVYWEALARYAAKEEARTFADIENELRSRGSSATPDLVSQAAAALEAHLRAVADYAVVRDRILRRGKNQLRSDFIEPEPDYFRWHHIARVAKISARSKSLIHYHAEEGGGFSPRSSGFNLWSFIKEDHQAISIIIAVIAAIVSIVGTVVFFYKVIPVNFIFSQQYAFARFIIPTDLPFIGKSAQMLANNLKPARLSVHGPSVLQIMKP